MSRFSMFAVVLSILSGCATGSTAGGASPLPSTANLPVCDQGVIAIAPSQYWSYQEALHVLQQTDWIPSTSTLVEATIKPQVSNRSAVSRALVANYPTNLRDRGLGGDVTFLLMIDENGSLSKTHMLTKSAYPALDEGARRTAEIMRFHPAAFEDCRAASVMLIPIIFRSAR